MRERRNSVLVLLCAIAIAWAFMAWVAALAIPEMQRWFVPSPDAHRALSLAALLVIGSYVVYYVFVQDKLSDELSGVTVGHYFEQDGLCFMPLCRVTRNGKAEHAEISLYYQNRYAGPCEAVIHLRPPAGAFRSHRGARDVHFAFIAEGGAFGVIHQPVAVHPDFQGQVVDVQLAAAVRWPRGHGDLLRSRKGQRCGTFNVDWALAYRQSQHELGGDIELRSPAVVHLALPERVVTEIERGEYRIEVIKRAG